MTKSGGCFTNARIFCSVFLLKTHCKNECRIQSHLVPKNLTLHRISKTKFQPFIFNPQMHSFPNMPNTIGSKMHGLAVRFLLTKKCLKNSFLKWHKSWSPEYVGAWLPQFLRFSTFSGVFLKIWDISFQMGHRHPFLDQNCPIGGHLNFFTKWHKKWKKTPFFVFFF